MSYAPGALTRAHTHTHTHILRLHAVSLIIWTLPGSIEWVEDGEITDLQVSATAVGFCWSHAHDSLVHLDSRHCTSQVHAHARELIATADIHVQLVHLALTQLSQCLGHVCVCVCVCVCVSASKSANTACIYIHVYADEYVYAFVYVHTST